MKISQSLNVGAVYSRKGLASTFKINDPRLTGTHGEGIIPLAQFDSILIFITEKKPLDRAQYEDKLVGHDLFMDGQKSKRTDEALFSHSSARKEVLVFYRRFKGEFDNYGYRFEGRFHYVSSKSFDTPRSPTRFHLRRGEDGGLDDIPWFDLLPAKDNLLTTPEGYEFPGKVSETAVLPFRPTDVVDERERILRSIVARQGQQLFRKALLEAYGRKCCVTNCDLPDALNAAHILPYFGPSTNHPTNGLLLRADVHVLFDLGYIGVSTERMTIRISPRLKQTTYFELDGMLIKTPAHVEFRPNKEALDIHRITVFQA